MGTFEQVMVGVVALLAVAWMWPGVRAAVARSKNSQQRDWKAVLFPIGAIILFVIILILIARP